MGKLFVTEIEGPVYKCTHCQIQFAVYEPLHSKSMVLFEYPASFGKLYIFNECYNVVIGTEQVLIGTINEYTDNYMCEVFCVCCGSHLGFYHESGTKSYNVGSFYINRFKIQGPPDGSDDENPGDESDNENSGDGTSEGSNDDENLGDEEEEEEA